MAGARGKEGRTTSCSYLSRCGFDSSRPYFTPLAGWLYPQKAPEIVPFLVFGFPSEWECSGINRVLNLTIM